MPKRKTVLITGSSKGLGRNLALAFARGGYDIILHGRHLERLVKAGEQCTELDVKCQFIIGDIISGKTIGELTVMAVENNLDILINNAAIYGEQPFGMMSAEKIRAMVETNLIAPLVLMNRIYATFVKLGRGLIININSIAGKDAGDNDAVYCATKHGLHGFTNSVRYQAIKNNVKILNVYLGAMQTDMVKERSNFDCFISPEEVANLIVQMTKDYKSLTIKEIDIGRCNY